MLQYEINLQHLNTFGINVQTKAYAHIVDFEQLKEIVAVYLPKYSQHLIMGGGSNLLFTKDYPGIILQMATKGIFETYDDNHCVLVTTAAGEVWNDLVDYCVDKGFWGIENLALIPGSVGASPVQNIGAYGVELKDVFHSLTALEIQSGNIREFGFQDCEFGYRNSFFKNEGKNQYIILTVTLKLHLLPQSRLEYGALKEEISNQRKLLSENSTDEISLKEIRDAVIRIRQRKLPDPSVLGNAGSFFKNPTIQTNQFELIKQEYQEIPFYSLGNDEYKIPAAWLIEKCGWKGFRRGDAGVHQNQALVLINYGGASGREILTLAEEIQNSVLDQFGIQLEMEVNIPNLIE